MDCPRCKLINPESAQRCDCGYDFKTGKVEKSYYSAKLPGTIKTGMIAIIIYNVVGALFLIAIDPSQIGFVIIWSGLIYWLYFQLIKKKDWARIWLMVVTFPIGLFLGLSREAKLYCMQKE